MNIFLDDLRIAPKKYDLVFRTGESFLDWLKENPETEIELMSFDHDLGEHVIDGYETVKRMVEMPNHISRIQFHTDNLIGLKNMYMYFRSAKQHDLMPNLRRVNPHKFICIDGVESEVTFFNAFRDEV